MLETWKIKIFKNFRYFPRIGKGRGPPRPGVTANNYGDQLEMLAIVKFSDIR